MIPTKGRSEVKKPRCFQIACFEGSPHILDVSQSNVKQRGRRMHAVCISELFAGNIRKHLEKLDLNQEDIYEIRLRIGRPLIWNGKNGEEFLEKDSFLYIVTEEDIRQTIEYMTGYSVYACQEKLCQGYISLPGGHRAGVAGQMVSDGEKITGIRNISSINVRLAHQIKGCADRLMPWLRSEGRIFHTLIVSPPGCGKTTLLRDIIRQLSDGCGKNRGVNVGVVDERSELGGAFQGVLQNDLGMRSDLLDGCQKAQGMQMLLRSMAPDVIAVDELGREEDFKAVESVIHCGCKLIATAHGYSIEELMEQPFFKRLGEEKVFERYILLEKRERAGMVKGIYDRNGCICSGF